MEQTLILVPSNSFYYFNSLKLPNVVVFPVFREVHGASEMVWKTMRKLRPVSYTHLDVYKRQDYINRRAQQSLYIRSLGELYMRCLQIPTQQRDVEEEK